MTHRTIMTLGIALLLVAASTPAAWAGRVEGEVIQVQQRVRTQNEGEFQQIRVRTRQGEEMELRLGAPEDCGACVQVGDRVRVRTCAGGPVGGAHQVRTMRVEGSGERYAFRNRGGDLLPDNQRGRLGLGDRDRDRGRDRIQDRDRTHKPGGGGKRGNGGGGGRG